MLAVLLKKGYLDANGKTTEEGSKLTDKELERLSDEIQRLNQMIHGRYSQREAATLQQSVWYRAAAQFRKWIPAAIEVRFDEKHYDPRLGVEIEGRYITFKNLIVNLKDTVNRLQSGELSDLEIYNMKKNLMELTLLAATVLMFAWLDDDEDDKKKKNPMIKAMLTLTNRVAGDIEFFYNPKSAVNLGKNAFPIAKTAGDLLKVFENLPYALEYGDYKYKKGIYKDQNKFYVSLNNIIVGLRPLQDVEKILNDNPLEEFR